VTETTVHFVVAANVAALVLARWVAQLWLERLNQRHVRAHAGAVPEPFRDTMDATTYARSVEYTLARSRLSRAEMTCDAAVLLAVLFSGVLPWGLGLLEAWLGTSAWAMAAFVFTAGVVLTLPGLPFAWHEQFHIETRFGFNTTTPRLWWTDRAKALLLSVLLGYPLVVLILKVAEWTGPSWWLWAWVCVMGWQLLMVVLAPTLILPLFNKFTPLPEGSLRERLLALARRTSFQAAGIQVMDGSKRSRHSNAFFTGFGRARKIVLFDTLIAQLNEPELEAVLAHEIGHYRRRHIMKMLTWSAAGLLAGLAALGWLAQQAWFCGAFGFEPGPLAPALLLFMLLGGAVTFWVSPAMHWLSRRHEFEADAFAAETVRAAEPLIAALRRLSEKNLSNLTPHPFYSRFYYSHPTLLERERALGGRSRSNPAQGFP
jgi:STE24 endopeptidase